mmetsp:Transcript_11353/g.22284  ORF Transcript_11353/g.22284 Transcript_11353/m.22284 type:complete len:83 (+) Transcript_11353:593-841(+)
MTLSRFLIQTGSLISNHRPQVDPQLCRATFLFQRSLHHEPGINSNDSSNQHNSNKDNIVISISSCKVKNGSAIRVVLTIIRR